MENITEFFSTFLFCKEIEKWNTLMTYHGFPNLRSIYLLLFQMSTEHDKRDVEAH